MGDTTTKQFIGKYQIEGLLGKGGMGSVYLGSDNASQTQVAIKVLSADTLNQDAELLERLKREGEALRVLNHPNIVKMLDVLQENNRYSLVLEYVEGGSLWDLLRKVPQLPINAVLKIALELADALARAHHLKIVHRDIKPANIMFARDGSLRLTDFGLARMEQGHDLTQSGMMVGSVAYLSPESINGHTPDAKMDIWAFGIVMFEMLTGRRPYDSENIGTLLTGILMDPIPDINELRPDIPPRLALLVMQMLDKDPDTRIASARKIGAELEQIIEILGVRDELTLPDEVKEIIGQARRIEPASPLPTLMAGPASQTILAMPQRKSGWAILIAVLALFFVAAFVIGQMVGTSNSDNDNERDNQGAAQLVTVEPVGENEMMVLVAHAEPFGDERPQLDRLMRENLYEILELSAPLIGVRIREYPQVIHSEEEARAVANLNHAPIVIWGSYDDDYIDLNINLYTHHEAPPMPINFLETTGNVRARLTDERSQSAAFQVLTSIAVWYIYHDQPYEAAAAMVTYYDLTVESAETVGVSVGTHVNRHYENLYDDPAVAVGFLDEALKLDPKNPILYHLRGAAVDRIEGKNSEAMQNVDSAQLLSEGKWSIPHLNMANLLASDDRVDEAIAELGKALAIRSDEWLYYAIRGSYYYLQNDYDHAEADLKSSIDNDPKANFPYTILMNIAIQKGQIEDVLAYQQTILEKFPDPTFGNRIILTAGSETEYGGYYALTLSAFNNLVLRQYDAALRDVNAAIEIRPDFPELYLFQGVIYCVDKDYENADKALTQGIELNPDMTVLYLLRADIKNKLGKPIEGLKDLAAAEKTSAWANFEPMINAALSGEGGGFGCESFFSQPTQ